MEKYNNNIDGTIDIQEQMAKNKKSAKKKILWTAGIFSLAAAVIATGTLVLRKDLKINPLLAQIMRFTVWMSPIIRERSTGKPCHSKILILL